VLELVAEGLEKEIGHQIGLSKQAVKEHVSALLRRLAVRNRAALAEIATQLKIAGTTDLQPEWLNYIYQRSPVMSADVRGRDHVFVSANDAFRRGAGSGDILGRPSRAGSRRLRANRRPAAGCGRRRARRHRRDH